MLIVRLADLAEVRGLQAAVLRPNGPLPADRPVPDDAVHVGAFEGLAAVGAASVVAAPWPGPEVLAGPTWQLRSMAVRADRRGSGVGRQVLDLAVATAFDRGAASMWAGARLEALGFYTCAGWTVVGPRWAKPGVGPHRWVTRTGAPRGDAAR
ncbi:MAG: GNAT family N-acetyltransferase [Candidatus Nanopelagicales bacterium]